MSTPRVHVVIPTHTDRHLRRTLLGFAHQTTAPASLTVTCDTDDPAIGQAIEGVASDTGVHIVQVLRPRHEEPRRSQVRNNGLRSLLARGLQEDDLVLFIDGDCLPAKNLVEVHGQRSRDGDFVIGYFIPLDEEETTAIDEAKLLRGDLDLCPSAEHAASLDRRQRRGQRQQWLRRFRLCKSHKPKAVTGNLAVRAGHVLAINGFDEAFMDWGFEDDDFTRRLYRCGARSTLAIRDAIVFHQWHPSLKGSNWMTGSTAARFATTTPTRCERGIQSPVDQHEVTEAGFGSSPA